MSGHAPTVTGAQDDELDCRLAAARRRVQHDRQDLRDLRRQLREAHAMASASTDAAVAAKLRARGIHALPPVPSHPPDDLER